MKCWLPPAGVFLSTFADFKQDEHGRITLYFQIHSLKDTLNEFWVRHVYRNQDMPTLTRHLLSWLGENELRQMISEEGLSLEKYLDKEARVEISLNRTGKYKDALRVISNIYPPDPTFEEQVGDGKFEI
jgi:hypothetical protein